MPAATRLPTIVRASIAALLLAATAEPRSAIAAFTAFESGHTHALALSADRTRLYALNTPDNRLEIFEVSDTGLLHLSSVPVGLEPVSVAERVPGEVWVVNRISDDVTIVSTVGTPRVVRTLLVGDEPADVVFAGVGRSRAFVTTARRGQNSPIPAQYLMPGIGRALVFVYDATDLGAAAGGEPIAVLELFGDAPRALASSADGSIVYAAIFHSGNRTTTIPASLVTWTGVTLLPNMSASPSPQPAPPPSQIVRFDDASGQWRDDQNRDWGQYIPFTLPDADVFAFNANASPAAMQASVVPYAHVGTVLFNMAVNPADGRVFVTNSDARNERRFEGAGAALASFPALPQKTVRGRLHQYRVTVIDPSTSAVTPRHLNKHINYDLTPEATAATDTADRSLATPLDVVIDAAGDNLYVAAFGSDKVGVLSPDALADNSFTPDDADHVAISGGGPTSLALDEPRERLYVLARFGQSISVVDLTDHPGSEIAVVPLPHDPEPASLRNGRRFLYDARLTSSNGEASCSSCHVFGNTDDLVWNLGDPDGVWRFNANLQAISTWGLNNLGNIDLAMELAFGQDFLPDNFFLEHHPLKGPLFTKSMRGLANGGPMHWGGDRSGGVGVRNDPDSLDEDAAFKSFNVAFRGLLGRTGPLSAPEMQAFTDFMLQVVYPPNPNRALDNSLTPAQASAKNIFLNVNVHSRVPAVANEFTCSDCHDLDPAAGFFGSGGRSSFRSGRTQILKVPHLRNLYSLAGMFGIPKAMPTPTGPQIRSVGLQHDGSVDTLLSFVEDPMLRFPGANEAEKAQNRLDMVDFLLAFDTESAPVLGQQVTLDDEGPTSPLLPTAAGTVQGRVDLLAARALVTAPIPECDLIVKAAFDGEPRGWWMSGANAFRPDRDGAATITLGALQTHADSPGRELTFMCVPPGSGERFGIDRDADGTRDGSQCGDVNLDGVVAANDAKLLRRALARVPGAALPLGRKCNAIGTRDLGDVDGDLVPNDCDIRDAAVLARDASALAPGAAQVCGSAESCASDPDGDYVCGSVDNCPIAANPDQADGDGDGVGDVCDSCPTDFENDPDADGVCESIDNCPGVANPGQANADADAQGDACDADDDGDALLDGVDNCSLVANPGQQNADGDAFGDVCDACPADAANDADADGYCADADNCPAVANPSQANSDGDALGDACDACPLDAANDGDSDLVCGDVDNCPLAPNIGQENGDADSLGDACDACPLDAANDADGDGHCASADNCPVVANPTQANADGDALGDACDACPADAANDSDADGHCADADNCPAMANPGQENADGDAFGDACDACPADPGNDTDADGHCADADNCPTMANPGQENADGDALGDACDACPADAANDADADGHCADADNCPTMANPGQENADGDALGDACDACPADAANDADADGHCADADNCPTMANPGQENADGDAFGDACDACPADAANDADADGHCADADNCPTMANPGQENADGDAFGDACDACPADAANDADADGHCADADNCPAIANAGQENADGDALGDACDACPADPANDSDADGHCADADNCPAIANAGQENADGDALGDACDACPADPANDSDADGHCADADNCPTIANAGQENADGDALGDACDACPADPANDSDADGHCADADNCPAIANAGQENSDGDAFGDACDACPADAANDADADGHCADADNCPAIANAGQQNADSDALGDACDACPADPANDADADGHCADADNCPTIANPGQEDSDEDGTGDACEL